MLVLLVGCASPVPTGSDEASAPLATGLPRPTPGVVVQVVPFHVDSAGPKGFPGFQAAEPIDGNETVTALLVELEWTGQYDLDLYLARTDQGGCLATPTGCAESAAAHYADEGHDGNYWNKAGRFGAPDSPARVEVPAAAYAAYDCAVVGCPWEARVQAKEGAMDVDGVLYVSVFFGQDIPAGYTAVGTPPPA